jgi:hypothetical protein
MGWDMMDGDVVEWGGGSSLRWLTPKDSPPSYLPPFPPPPPLVFPLLPPLLSPATTSAVKSSAMRGSPRSVTRRRHPAWSWTKAACTTTR